MNIWEILGIEPTTDAKAVKRAYSAQLKQIDRKNDIDGFQRLHTAYQMALASLEGAEGEAPSMDGEAVPRAAALETDGLPGTAPMRPPQEWEELTDALEGFFNSQDILRSPRAFASGYERLRTYPNFASQLHAFDLIADFLQSTMRIMQDHPMLVPRGAVTRMFQDFGFYDDFKLFEAYSWQAYAIENHLREYWDRRPGVMQSFPWLGDLLLPHYAKWESWQARMKAFGWSLVVVPIMILAVAGRNPIGLLGPWFLPAVLTASLLLAWKGHRVPDTFFNRVQSWILGINIVLGAFAVLTPYPFSHTVAIVGVLSMLLARPKDSVGMILPGGFLGLILMEPFKASRDAPIDVAVAIQLGGSIAAYLLSMYRQRRRDQATLDATQKQWRGPSLAQAGGVVAIIRILIHLFSQ